jgi:hypothetical protein
MTSVIRYTATTKELPVKLTGISGPYYDDSVYGYQLFPFTFTNGILDLNINSDNFITWFNDGEKPESTGTSGYKYAKLMGGNNLVLTLGPNFIQYIKNAWTPDADTPITIYTNPVMTKVQYSDQNILDADDEAYTESDIPPSGDSYVWGTETDNFKTTWIFKTPLTFTIVVGGVTKYITMYTVLQTDYA